MAVTQDVREVLKLFCNHDLDELHRVDIQRGISLLARNTVSAKHKYQPEFRLGAHPAERSQSAKTKKQGTQKPQSTKEVRGINFKVQEEVTPLVNTWTQLESKKGVKSKIVLSNKRPGTAKHKKRELKPAKRYASQGRKK